MEKTVKLSPDWAESEDGTVFESFHEIDYEDDKSYGMIEFDKGLTIERSDYILSKSDVETERSKWIDWIRETSIEIAEAAHTKNVGSDENYEYYETELGMKIIVPKGKINELRFSVRLGSNQDIIAIDGFPKDLVETKYIIGGKISLAIDKAFKFLPIVGQGVSKIIDVTLDPWEFHIGDLRDVSIDFSGGLTSHPEWYFRKKGIKNDLKVALTIRTPKPTDGFSGIVEAAWLYDPGFFKKVRVQSDTREVKII